MLLMTCEVLSVFLMVSLSVGTFQICFVTFDVVKHILVPSQELRRGFMQQVQKLGKLTAPGKESMLIEKLAFVIK